MKYLLGADVGTTSLKMVLFDENGNEIKSLSKDYTLGVSGDRVEFDAEKYWEMFCGGFEELSAEHPIHALAIDTQCETLIVTDEDGKPLRPAIVWLDNRADAQAKEIERVFGTRRVYEVTGQPEVTATWPACKLLWLKQSEPEVFTKTKKVFLLEDYLLYKLTGRFVTEKTLQSSSLYFDIHENKWWQEMLEYIGVSSSVLPEILGCAEPVGRYKGAQVITGAIDQIAGAIGAGVVRGGIVSEMTGTTMVVFVPCDTVPPYSAHSKVPCHVNYDGYCLLSWTPTAGMALKWFKNILCEDFSFKQLDALAEAVPPGSAGLTFLPYLCGSTMPNYNPDAKGAFLGLTLEHTRGHFVRAVMESVACMLKESLDYLGLDCTQIRAMGGGATSPLWCRMKADMTGKPIVTLQKSETACLGSAILAGVGSGIFESVPAACEKLVQKGKTYLPEGTDYTDTYRRFCELEERFI